MEPCACANPLVVVYTSVMQTSLLMTVLGPDRPGIVETLSGLVADNYDDVVAGTAVETVEQSLAVLSRLDSLCDLGYPILLGTSRKSFIV